MTDEVASILDQTLDQLADMPTFDPFPDGSHKARIKWEEKKINGIPSVELKMEHIEVVELTNPEEAHPKPGQVTNCLYMMKTKDGEPNEMGQGGFKKALQQLKASGVEGTTPREVMEASNNMECLVVSKKRPRKDSNGKETGEFNTNLVNIGIV